MFYERKIKYLEYRVSGERISGVGFVKLEARDTMCSIQLNISGLFRTAGIKDTKASVLLQSGLQEKELAAIALGPEKITYEFPNMQMENMKGTGIAYLDLDAIRIVIAPEKEIYCAVREHISRAPENTVEPKTEHRIPNERDSEQPEYNYEMPDEAEQPEYNYGISGENREPEYSSGMYGGNVEPEYSSGIFSDNGEPEYNYGISGENREAEYSFQVSGENGEPEYNSGMPGENREPEYSSEVSGENGEPEYNYGMSDENREAEYSSGISGGDGEAEYNYEMSDETKEPQYSYEEPNIGEEVEPECEIPDRSEHQESGFEMPNEVTVQEQIRDTYIPNTHNATVHGSDRKKRRECYRREEPQMSGTFQKESRLQENKWHQLSAIYPHIRPFQDEREYLSISPDDFVVLSEKFYKLIHNSFLLHGYYNYRHLILQRMEQRGEVKYYIGVPGNFFDKEKQVAVMFGFESFECMDEPARSGDYGYYMMRVEI